MKGLELEQKEYELKMRGMASMINDGTDAEQASKVFGIADETQNKFENFSDNVIYTGGTHEEHHSTAGSTIGTVGAMLGAAALLPAAAPIGMALGTFGVIKRTADWLSRLDD